LPASRAELACTGHPECDRGAVTEAADDEGGEDRAADGMSVSDRPMIKLMPPAKTPLASVIWLGLI
jgi:hypothetical protein